MSIKRIITLMLALVLALSMVAMAGCGGDKGSGYERPDDGEGFEPSGDDEFYDSVPDELVGTTVDFATWIDHFSIDHSAANFGAFEKRTGIKVALTKVAQGDYTSKISGLIASDNSPDVIVDIQFPSTAQLLMPLEDAGVDATDPFWDQKITEIGHIGKYHYLVNGANSIWRMGTPYVIFNRTNMEDYGITTPTDYVDQGNWTLETFLKCADQCKKMIPNTQYGASIAARWFLSAYGDPIFSYDSATSTFSNTSTTTPALNAWKWLLEGKESGVITPYDDQGGNMQDGRTHMYLGGGYSMRTDGWLSDTMDSMDLGFACLPKRDNTDAKYPTAAQWRAYGICKGAKDAQAAGYFLRFFLNGDNYDWNTVFKTEEAMNLYKSSIGTWDYNRIDWCDPFVILTGTRVDVLLEDALGSSSAQINVNLQKTSNLIGLYCERANKELQAVINDQQ